MRSTISLAVICKNESKNIERFLESFAPYVDEVCITDTGSTDDTIEKITKAHHSGKYKAPIYLHRFEWVNDFAAARNFAFEQATCDYVCWADCDDSLHNPEAFVKWRNDTMHMADFWLATYDYALDKDGNPTCSFARERAIKRSRGFKWKYFVHEGIIAQPTDNRPVQAMYAPAWRIRHLRDEEDQKADRSRNLDLFKHHMDTLDARMRYYYGKELFENHRPKEALDVLVDAVGKKDLELHDRTLGVQYAAMAAIQVDKFDLAIHLAHQGLVLEPQRAEFLSIIGDAYLKKYQPANAIPYLAAAANCKAKDAKAGVQGPIFAYQDAYGPYPMNQMARALAHTGEIDRAIAVAKSCLTSYGKEETALILRELEALKAPSIDQAALIQVPDVWITCPPNSPYEFDGDVAKKRGIGGSETACVQIAEELVKLGEKVVVFNPRKEDRVVNGVHYVSTNHMYDHSSKFKPKVHIAWRHNMFVTPSPSYVWSHDLGFPGIDQSKERGYEKVMGLSNFHKAYLRDACGVPEEHILITRNGIDPKRFENLTIEKVKGRVAYSSSPDRGLDRVIKVLDLARKTNPEITLDVFYGFEGMEKSGFQKEADALKAMIADRPWINFHGNVQQDELAKKLTAAQVWLYPTNFLETFAICAIEMLAAKAYPVVRKWGAVPNTLSGPWNLGECDIIDMDCETPEQVAHYAQRVLEAIEHEKWKNVSCDLSLMSWESVAREWLAWFPKPS